MSMQRVQEAMRVHRLAKLRGARVTPDREGWSVAVDGRKTVVRSMADAERLLLSMPVALPDGGIFCAATI